MENGIPKSKKDLGIFCLGECCPATSFSSSPFEGTLPATPFYKFWILDFGFWIGREGGKGVIIFSSVISVGSCLKSFFSVGDMVDEETSFSKK
jgi:hypothetical protein